MTSNVPGNTRMLWVLLAMTTLTTTIARADEVGRHNPITRAIEKCRASIVSLKTMRVIPARFDNVDAGRVRGLGTGVLIDPRGYLVTNYHVVEDVDEIEARTADGRLFSADIVTTDQRNDLAVLKINTADPLPTLSLSGAGPGILGETVIAIGNPYGLEDSVTIGIVSAIDRELKLPNGEVFQGLIQTDASINPGNSGGPLITIEGELLGINVAIRSNAQGIAFAIPTVRVREILASMMNRSNQVQQAGLDVDPEPIIRVGGIAGTRDDGIRIRQVLVGSPAEQAGFAPGDELIDIDGQPIKIRFDVERVLWDRHSSDVLPVHVRRGGEELDLELRVGADGPSDDQFVWDNVGIRVRPVVDPVRRAQPKWEGGLLIMQVRDGSPAAQAGIRPGDILAGLHDRMVLEARHIRLVMKMPGFGSSQPVRFHIIRDGQVTSSTITLPAIP